MKLKGDLAAERGVLAGICKYGEKGLVDVNDILTIDCFTSTSNQLVFQILKKTLETATSVDLPSILSSASELNLSEFLKEKDEIDYIKSLFNFGIKLENVRNLAKKIRKIDIAKKLQLKLKEAYEALNVTTGNESVSSILSLAESPIFEFSTELDKNNDDKPEKLFANIKEYLDYLTENPVDIVGIPTGFPVYDDAIGGGQRPGSINLIVARSKNGKSSLAKEIALNVTDMDIPVLIIDTEMNKEDQIHRSLSSLAKIEIKFIETGKFGLMTEKTHVYEKAAEYEKKPIYYKNVAGKPFEDILSIIRRWVRLEVGTDDKGNTNPCLVMYDYFKLMDTNDLRAMQEYQAIGFQVSKLTDFANQYQVSVLAFCQANRSALSSQDTDIISQSDRLLWFCGSATFLRRKTAEEIAQDGPDCGNTVLIPLASRYGPGLIDGDYINLMFDARTSKLSELGTKSQIQAKTDNGFDIEDKDDF